MVPAQRLNLLLSPQMLLKSSNTPGSAALTNVLAAVLLTYM